MKIKSIVEIGDHANGPRFGEKKLLQVNKTFFTNGTFLR